MFFCGLVLRIKIQKRWTSLTDYVDFCSVLYGLQIAEYSKKNKSKIEISLGINKLEDLLAQKEKIAKDLSIQTFLKKKNITSKRRAKDISVELEKKYAEKEISKIELEEKDDVSI